MAKPRPDGKRSGPGEEFGEQVNRRAERKLYARRHSKRSAWFGLGMFGLVGWSVALPALIGVAVGLWLDERWPDTVSWTLTLLIIGVALGCLNAWYWINQERDRD